MKVGDLVMCKTYGYVGIIIGEHTSKFNLKRWHIMWGKINRISKRTSSGLKIVNESR